LGDSFLRNFYSIWDEENDQIGFAQHITSTATITVGAEPTDILEPSYDDLTDNPSASLLSYFDLGAISLMGLTYTGFMTAFFVVLGTVFFGDFTRPIRRMAGMIVHAFNKNVDPEIFTATNNNFDETVINV
jgi:hypothetical protein